ncbi:hypothetical protein ACFO1V_06105 [Daeguia caeni]|uniref:Potassium channel domain-containing protein n=1 Tax=Daeguia caeni TaxID=439612 RepID=A0ABV9H5X8_9HYPH
MLKEFIVGTAVGMTVMLVHLISTLIIYYFVQSLGNRIHERRVTFLIISMVALYAMLFICVCCSVGIWAYAYQQMGFTVDFRDAFYTAMLNYTTLGSGYLNQVIQTRLLGPMTAASGILMFAWSAALLVYVIQLHLPTLFKPNRR